MKSSLSAVLFSLAIVIAAFLLGQAVLNRNSSEENLLVTGLGKTDFESDLVVWSGNFNASHPDLKTAYAQLEQNRNIIRNYLLAEGLSEETMVFSSVSSYKKNRTLYTPDGKYRGEEFEAHVLNQNLKVESKEVDKVERISREISELLNQGVNFYSEAPRYYYSELADLKIEMISKATEDARLRAETIAAQSGAKLGKLLSARMGVFQITGRYSAEEYSWGGTFNTSDRKKTASITMKLTYQVR